MQIPEPEQVIAEIADLVPITYSALEVGVFEARRYFEERRDEYEPHLFSALVRHSAKKHFRSRNLRAEYEILDLANNGLYLVYKGYPIRIRKAYRGTVAVPGSFALEQFHAQILPLGFTDVIQPNLFIVWDVYKPSYSLAPDLYVACPRKNSARFPDAADLHWQWKLPNVALFPGQAIEADGYDEYEDLPIRKPEEQTGSDDDA
jgi:hypothetical protein